MNIRNFSIIAHVDHGKSTLADRILEKTGAIEKREMKNQILDNMELERERGITIKMQPVSIKHTYKEEEYLLNLIDTPGHIDFSYEVSRSLKAVEGVLLLIDATQGVQAQTLSVLDMALQLNLKIIPVLTKIDSDYTNTKVVTEEIISLLKCEEKEIYKTSGKTGEGVLELLDGIIEKIPEPKNIDSKDPLALVFDFSYSSHNGIIAYARVFSKSFSKKGNLKFVIANKVFQLKDIGILTPKIKTIDTLEEGMIGYFTTGIKEPGVALVGDTISKSDSVIEPLGGYEDPKVVIWTSIYPQNSDEYNLLGKSLKELKLTDSSLTYEDEKSLILGKGYRCGFLGMLHLEIITERLKREAGLDLVITSPSTDYLVKKKKGEEVIIATPSLFPDTHEIEKIYEPWVELSIIIPSSFIGVVSKIISDFEGVLLKVNDFKSDRTIIEAEMPLREMMRNFFDKLKTVTSGYASLSYKRIGEREADVVRMDILIAEEVFPAFSSIISKKKINYETRNIVGVIHKLLPRENFIIKIQAKINGKIIASKTLSAFRKDVTAKLYGGDVTRKMKLKEKQKKGKKKMQGIGRVRIKHDTFIDIMKNKNL